MVLISPVWTIIGRCGEGDIFGGDSIAHLRDVDALRVFLLPTRPKVVLPGAGDVRLVAAPDGLIAEIPAAVLHRSPMTFEAEMRDWGALKSVVAFSQPLKKEENN